MSKIDIQKEIERRKEEIKNLVPKTVIEAIDAKIEEIRAVINSKVRRDLTEPELDELYAQITKDWNVLTDLIKNIEYKFPLTGSEARFLKKFVYNEAPLDFERVFIANTLEERFFKRYEQVIAEANAGDILDLNIEVTDSIWIHSLMKEFTTRGFNEQAKLFMMVITKIGDISKYYEEIDGKSKQLSQFILDFFQDVPQEKEKEAV